MYVPEVTRRFYPTKEDLAEDVVGVLRSELSDLSAEGADFVQFDEPELARVPEDDGLHDPVVHVRFVDVRQRQPDHADIGSAGLADRLR